MANAHPLDRKPSAVDALGMIGATRLAEGQSRRAFLKQCAIWATFLALPAGSAAYLAQRLATRPRKPVVWLSLQDCTGCTESFVRSHHPTFEALLFELISLDYHHSLQAAAGDAAEQAKQTAIAANPGRYLLVIEGSVPVADAGRYSTCRGKSALEEIKHCSREAEVIFALGSCSSYGGIAQAQPNPTGAVGVHKLMEGGLIAERPLVNIPGCPPLTVAMGAVLAHYLVFDRLPRLDGLRRPLALYGHSIHERCPRLHYYQQGKFAKSFDDEGARNGWCLFELGCKGPTTHNACATLGWNQGTSFPIQSGHPCLGCTEPSFWDAGGFYRPLVESSDRGPATATRSDKELFNNRCGGCHYGGPQAFKSAPSEVQRVVRSGVNPAHDALQLSEQELQRIADYVESLSH